MTKKYEIGDIKACYWPAREPKIVIITNVLEGEDLFTGETELSYSVKVANSGIYTGARPEYLKDFDHVEFKKAVLKYKIKEYDNKVLNYRCELDRMEEKHGSKV